ncbi:hypothetical protein SASPL_156363 [Salvia splendens]|uniref:Myb/SANT-like domain-containing protein n=1 Tax=Salvia splendens TaxID=180675 RepID=A0A8X8VWU4_SALSN|nr:hypothetical protein SASPL_156363 [Salvia splendens]
MSVLSLIDMASQHTEGSEDDGSPEGSKDFGPNRNAKSDRSRRIWSAREEEILMATLKELAANGWKSDNGFRNGYLVRAREAIKSEFPNTDILPHPHLLKDYYWKRNYRSLKTMLNYNGIGFNSDGTYRVECDDEQWVLFSTGYGDSDHSDAPDVDTSDDYVPTQSEGGDSSDGDDYASDAGVLDEDGCPTFTVTLDSSNINSTLEFPMAFWSPPHSNDFPSRPGLLQCKR